MPDPQNPVVIESGSISPRELAQQLNISLAELARMVGVSRSTLAAEPLGRKGRDALTPLVRLLAFATEMAGSLEGAVDWFKNTPIGAVSLIATRLRLAELSLTRCRLRP